MTKTGDILNDLRPEARDLIAEAMKHKDLYKDGYPTILNMLTEIEQDFGKPKAMLFACALILEGYPKETLGTISKLMGWI